MSYEEKFREIDQRRNLNKKERLEKERMQKLAGIKPTISPRVQEFLNELKKFEKLLIENLGK